MTPHLAEQPQQQAREVLLPCPFCGATGDDLLMAVPPGPDHVYCRSCCSSGPVRERIAEANDAWNTRAPAPQGDAGDAGEVAGGAGEIADLQNRLAKLEAWAHEPFDFTNLIRRIDALEAKVQP
jgi:hypothetical protein